ncbi:hypothetical protein EYF80_053129 [Liparis tanakae]|uniref:Uncharacterized protein n=1 Tax=Liparis tanakae TaxID=230148 RepID=A0A4Z2F7C2_9TELE|nr:hypothetical protein EYF80_053129 [Liparis tanakae]
MNYNGPPVERIPAQQTRGRLREGPGQPPDRAAGAHSAISKSDGTEPMGGIKAGGHPVGSPGQDQGEEARALERPETWDQGPGARDQGPGTRDQGPGTRGQGPGTRDQGPGTRDQGPGTRDQGPGTRDQDPGTRDQGPGTRIQGPGTRDQDPGTRDQGPGSRDQASAAQTFQKELAPRRQQNKGLGLERNRLGVRNPTSPVLRRGDHRSVFFVSGSAAARSRWRSSSFNHLHSRLQGRAAPSISPSISLRMTDEKLASCSGPKWFFQSPTMPTQENTQRHETQTPPTSSPRTPSPPPIRAASPFLRNGDVSWSM